MKARWKQIGELARSLWRLRPHVRAGRWLVCAVAGSALLAARHTLFPAGPKPAMKAVVRA